MDSHQLKHTHLEVLSLVAQGKKNKEIAERLNLGTEAIRSRLKNIYEILDVKNRTAAVIKTWDQIREVDV